MGYSNWVHVLVIAFFATPFTRARETFDIGARTNLIVLFLELITPAVVMVTIKAFSCLRKHHKLNELDYSMLLVLALAAVQMVFTVLAAYSGLGQHREALTIKEIHVSEAQLGIALLFFLLLPYAARITVLRFNRSLSRQRWPQSVIDFVIGLNGVCLTIFVFLYGYSYSYRFTEEKSNKLYVNEFLLWTSILIAEVGFELVGSFIPICLLWKVQIRGKWNKFGTIFLLAIRIWLIPIDVYLMNCLSPFQSSNDFTLDITEFVKGTVVHTSVSVCFLIIPFIKPVLDNLRSGIFRADLGEIAPGRRSDDDWAHDDITFDIPLRDLRG